MKILVLGYFGYRTNQLDGQTVKTRDTYRLLSEKMGKENRIVYFDTQEFQYSKASLLKMIAKLLTCNILIYLPAHNNLKYIFPLVFMLSFFSRFHVLYLVIGGWLSEFLVKLPLHQYMLRKIKGIFTETLLLKNELETRYGFKNVYQLYNFRFNNSIPVKHHTPGELHLVFMARVNKMKGIDTIFSLAAYIKENRIKVTIDFYGPIHKEDEEYFVTQVKKYSNLCYKGIVEPLNINTTLQQYDAMLLPTHYYTEGLPGSIIDAYMAGIPVIVTNWKHAKEFIDEEKTGFIIPFVEGEEMLFSCVERLWKNEELLSRMKENAWKKSKLFSDTTAWNILEENL